MKTSRTPENFSADIPGDLVGADETLSIYGRWAADRPPRKRCGSAEGHYMPTGWQAVDARRESKPAGMTLPDLMACQRALSRVAELERMVLGVLYVPRRMPVEQQLRLLNIPARLCRERHLHGLRMFDNLLRHLLHSRPNDAASGQRTALS